MEKETNVVGRIIDSFTLFDDALMSKVFDENIEATESIKYWQKASGIIKKQRREEEKCQI